MTNLRLTILAALSLAACTVPSAPAAPVPPPPPNTFTVVGTATLEVEPDTADLHVTVSAQATRPGAATKAARAKQEKLVVGMLALGVEVRDIKLSLLQIGPVWDEKYTRVVGYVASIAVTASTHDFDRIGSMMEAAADAGATSMSSSFHADLPALKRKVRDLALSDAKDKADQIGSSLGLVLGKVVAVDESGAVSYSSYDSSIANTVMQEPTQSSSSASGELQPLTLSISVTYQLA
jgi:uncharacterized protein YggE